MALFLLDFFFYSSIFFNFDETWWLGSPWIKNKLDLIFFPWPIFHRIRSGQKWKKQILVPDWSITTGCKRLCHAQKVVCVSVCFCMFCHLNILTIFRDMSFGLFVLGIFPSFLVNLGSQLLSNHWVEEAQFCKESFSGSQSVSEWLWQSNI